jgi:signal transduction histidine kinase
MLTDRLVSAQEEERMRISRELHDEAGQALTSLKISLDLTRGQLPEEQAALRKTLGDLGALAGETMDTLRMLAHDLRPPGLDAFGLNVALEGLCHDYAKRTLLSVAYTGTELAGLRTTVALSLYRLVQEALTNIAKHAEARSVSVNLAHADQALHLTIIDDGKGFSMDSNGQQHNGIGLVSMQERTDMLGGTLEIDTAPGRGTRLTARIPVELDAGSDYER